ncbi:MAG TPA: hypothetical protein PK511_10515 [Chitinophagales bacterium]|nr:hypothetical protein [Chitinophagales bacterium]HMU69276.1 hypothetical protein [Chitinophagales bacterium]HMX04881.1 hypothetical protein [Chitinophagales bacterium]HMZ90583.1 hypothetical protein [Chitinophagales bacterium]HNA59014.1 hypothetical protein [Chitinophagales bacterium]
MKEDLEAIKHLQNNTPIEAFEGLTPSEMHCLLYNVYDKESSLQMVDTIDDAILDQIPIFRIAEVFLHIIQRENGIKLTLGGSLPVKVLTELYNYGYILEDFIEKGYVKLRREQDCAAILSARLTVELTGLVKRTNGKLTLTKAGIKLLNKYDRNKFFHLFMQAFTNKFAWSCNDGYGEDPVAQFGWAFSVILLDKYGDKPQEAIFYSEKFLNAFPNSVLFFQPGLSTPEHFYASCYELRTFHRFFEWFGFVNVEGQHNLLTREFKAYTKSEIINKIFRIVQ